MPIKNINDLLNMTITNQKKKRIREQVQENIKNSSSMKEVVPPLSRGDFLNSWKEDRKALEETRKELDKYKKIVNTKFSSELQKEVLNDKNKKN